MGSSTIYCTTLVKCKKQLEEITHPFFVCLNNGCVNYKQPIESKFCPHCGKERVNEPKKAKQPKQNPFEIMQKDLGEKLYSPFAINTKENDYYISNQTDGKEPRILPRLESGENCIKEISPESIQNHIAWFRDKYSKEIMKLKELYGEENISLSFGLIIDAS